MGAQEKRRCYGAFFPEIGMFNDGSVERVLECLARLESRHLGGGNVNGGPGLWVAPGARRPIADRKCSEADQRHGVRLLQGVGNGIERGIECAAGRCLRDIGSFGNSIDEFSLIHSRPLVDER